jgi:hypothetical protein
MSASRGNSTNLLNWPVYWFLLLDDALIDGNFEAAAEAVRQLKRLGIEVRYRQRPYQEKTTGVLQEVFHAQ